MSAVWAAVDFAFAGLSVGLYMMSPDSVVAPFNAAVAVLTFGLGILQAVTP